MALISIKIKEFDNAKGYSGDAKDEALDYRDALNDKIISKMNKYSGSGSSNISQAKKLVNEKRTQLSDKADSFGQLEKDIGTLRTNIVNAETNLTNKIETVVGNFCNKYGLKSERSLFAQFFDWAFGDIDDALAKFFKNISVNFKNWYRYNGGREVINLVGAIIGVVAAVVGIVIAALASCVIVAVAGVIAGIIALATSVVQLVYAARSVAAASSDDPVWARRYETYSEKETLQSTLRRMGAYEIATIVDVVNIICTVITIVGDAVDFIKDVKKLGGIKNFVKQTFANFKTNLGNIKNACTKWGDEMAMAWKTFTTSNGTAEKFRNFTSFIKQGFKGLDNFAFLKTLFSASDTKGKLKNFSSMLKITIGTFDLTKDLADGKNDAWAEYFGKITDVAAGYLLKMGQKDLMAEFKAGDYASKMKDVGKQFQKTDYAQKASQLYESLSQKYTSALDKSKIGSNLFKDVYDAFKDGVGVIKDGADVIAGFNLTLDNFKYDSGDRGLVSDIESCLTFEKLFKKISAALN